MSIMRLYNVLDVVMFLALAKGVSKNQRLFHEDRCPQCEKLWKVLAKAYAKYLEVKIAGSFAHPTQGAVVI